MDTTAVAPATPPITPDPKRHSPELLALQGHALDLALAGEVPPLTAHRLPAVLDAVRAAIDGVRIISGLEAEGDVGVWGAVRTYGTGPDTRRLIVTAVLAPDVPAPYRVRFTFGPETVT